MTLTATSHRPHEFYLQLSEFGRRGGLDEHQPRPPVAETAASAAGQSSGAGASGDGAGTSSTTATTTTTTARFGILQDANGRNVSAHAMQRIRQLDVTFAMVPHYHKMFDAIFPLMGPAAAQRGAVLRELKEFTWTLFLLCKNRLPKISPDPLSSFLLLVACVRYCYFNVLEDHMLRPYAVDARDNMCNFLCAAYAGMGIKRGNEVWSVSKFL